MPKSRDSVEQDQFLTILSREDALARFEAALFPRAIPSETRPLADALGCALAEDIVAPIDVPPFDRSNVDGFAVRSADLASAGEATPVRVVLNDEVIACGVAPARPVLPGTATPIATGGPVPRGADAIVMVEHTQPAGDGANRDSPRGVARTIRLLCRLRHRARRGAAARRHHDRLARDRHARRLRDRRCRRGAEAARGRDLHRRRTGPARPAAAPGRDLRHQRRDRRRGGERERRRSGVSRRHPRRRARARSRDAQGA